MTPTFLFHNAADVCYVVCVRKESIMLHMIAVNWNGWTYREKYVNHTVLVSVLV